MSLKFLAHRLFVSNRLALFARQVALAFLPLCIAGCSGQGANLSGANLSGANVTNANFTGAIYDKCTRFPTGFNPNEHGMIKVEKQGDCASVAAGTNVITPQTPAIKAQATGGGIAVENTNSAKFRAKLLTYVVGKTTSGQFHADMKDVLGYDMGPSDSSMINGASTYEKYEYTIVEGKLHFIVEFNSSAGITDKSTITSISISQ